MNKRIISIVVVIVVVILAVWAFQNKGSSGKPVIKIGIVAPVTGNYAAYGSTLVKGVEMALSDISTSTKYQYQVIVEDDESTPAKSSNAANKLINIDGVKAIITTTSGSGNAVKPLAEKAGVINICDCNDVTIGNANYNFTNLLLPVDEMKLWLTEAKKRGAKNIVVLNQIHPGFIANLNAMLPQVDSFGMKIVYKDSFAGDNRDFKTIVAKAKQANADIYLVLAFPPSLDIISRELKNAGISNISTTASFTTSPTPELYNGLWFTDSTLTDFALKTRFDSLYPNIKFNARTVPYGYDIFNMLVQSFEKGGDVYANVNAITEYDGKVGKITKAADSHNFRSDASIWTMVDGKPVMVTN